MSKQFCHWDLETVPDESRIHLFGLPELQSYVETPESELPDPAAFLAMSMEDMKASAVRPSAKWLDALRKLENASKKPRKGAFEIIDRMGDIESMYEREAEERIKLLSTTPEYCSVAAMGWCVQDGDTESMVVGEEVDGRVIDERDIIDKFWQLAAKYIMVGFNTNGFDWPVIWARSAVLRIKPSVKVDLTPWKNQTIDLYSARFPRGNMSKDRPGKLKELAPLYGLVVGDEGTDGGAVYKLMKNREFDKVGKYVRSDVDICVQLHQVFEGLFV